MKDIEEQWFQNFRCIVPVVEVEGLKTAEGQRVLDVIEDEAILPGARPAMSAIFNYADDLGEV